MGPAVSSTGGSTGSLTISRHLFSVRSIQTYKRSRDVLPTATGRVPDRHYQPPNVVPVWDTGRPGFRRIGVPGLRVHHTDDRRQKDMTEGAHRWPTTEPDAGFPAPQGGLLDPQGHPAAPSDAQGWTTFEQPEQPAAPAAQWPGAADLGPGVSHPPVAHGRRPRREFSGRRLAVTVLVILLVAGAGAGGVVYGYNQAKAGTAEYYQPRMMDLQSQLATAQAILAKQSAGAAAVPNLAAIAAKHSGMDALDQTATSLEVTYRASDPDAKIVAVYAFMTELGFTGATLDRMGKTRALDGTLTAEGRNCNVSWTYHPDDGLQMVFEAKAG